MTPRPKNRLNRVAILRYDGRHQEGETPSSLERTNRQAGSADMEVQGPGSLQRSVPISPVKSAPGQSTAGAKSQTPASSKPNDEVQISSAGQLLDKLSKSPEVRAERLAQIKAAIASGEYDSDEKLEAAMMSLLQSIVLNESRD
jgi:negative regulator of flagellin synthesis FlgM